MTWCPVTPSPGDKNENMQGALLVSREPELRRIESFLTGDEDVSGLVLIGAPGIGKTTVWEAGLDRARSLGYAVLLSRSSQAEAGLLFAGVADLLEGFGAGVLDVIPGPQRNALEVALGRAPPGGAAPAPSAISSGFLSGLRTMAQSGPVLVAVDDVRWLDPSSAECLTFAARRLGGNRVRFLLSRRAGRPTPIEKALPGAGAETLELGPLNLPAVSLMLCDRFEAGFPRRVLRQVYDASHGNPLFALELGRAILEGGMPEVGAELRLSGLVDDVVGVRVRTMPMAVRRVLLAVALSAGLTAVELAAVADPLAVEEALASGLLVLECSRLRPSHPMLSAAVRELSTAEERQEIHLALASVVTDETLRARHFALATVAADAQVASLVAVAGEIAFDRGDVHTAEELAAHAIRLTPVEAPDHPRRLLDLARYHLTAGDFSIVRELLAARLGDIPGGRMRAEAHLLLGEAVEAAAEEAHLDQALREAGDEPDIKAVASARRTVLLVVNRVERIGEAEGWADQALAAAAMAGLELDPRILFAVAWARIMKGRQIDDLGEGLTIDSVGATLYEASIERPRGVRLAFRGQIDEARRVFERLLGQADERGDARLSLVLHIQLCELETRGGNVLRASEHLQDLNQWMALEEVLVGRSRLRSVIAAVAGDAAEARMYAESVLESPLARSELVWDRLEAQRAVGIAALLERQAGPAAESLGAVWDHTRRHQVDDPGAFPVGADLVEALVECGEPGRAGEVQSQLADLAAEQSHPWGSITAVRCAAAIAMRDGPDEAAANSLLHAAREYLKLGLEYDAARTLLFLGARGLRYNNRPAAAAEALVQAAGLFERLGCAGWAARAQAELAG
jgi:tetratricopeptide (TPR) repeat protein